MAHAMTATIAARLMLQRCCVRRLRRRTRSSTDRFRSALDMRFSSRWWRSRMLCMTRQTIVVAGVAALFAAHVIRAYTLGVVTPLEHADAELGHDSRLGRRRSARSGGSDVGLSEPIYSPKIWSIATETVPRCARPRGALAPSIGVMSSSSSMIFLASSVNGLRTRSS